MFASLKELLAKASPLRAGDQLAGVAPSSAEENIAAKLALADVPLTAILSEFWHIWILLGDATIRSLAAWHLAPTSIVAVADIQ